MKQFYSFLLLLSAATAGAQSVPPQAGAPVACNASNCLSNSNIDVCPPGSNTVVSSHVGGTYFSGNNGNHLGANAIWRYRNFAVVDGVTINCEVKIDAIVQATLNSIDDDAAVDQSGNSIASLFSPRIGPDQNLNGTDRRGYVQFTMSFYKNITGANNNTSADFANSVSLSNINYVHYDIDGNDAGNVSNGGAGSWFRETGAAKRISVTNPSIMANSPTELVAYNYTDPASTSWAGFAGSVCERDGVSKCAQIAVSYSYANSQTSITFRMGYDYNAGGNIGQPIRQFGSRLGCFNFPAQITLPVTLTAFSGSYRNNGTLLSWETESEINFDHYEIERSTDNVNYLIVGSVPSQSLSSKSKYQYTDNLSSAMDNVFFYRLKMVDIDGKYKYSNIIMVRRDATAITGITISPNPIIAGGAATVRLNSDARKNVEIRIIDASGRMVLKQQNQLTEGMNSIAFNNLGNIQSGIYTVQVVSDEEILSTRLSVIR